MTPTVALIHATPAAMAPARDAFADRFPQARVWNLLDDLLISQAQEAGEVTSPLRARMERLIEHAITGGADAVLLTCSMYGPVAHEVVASAGVPVLASDDALFAAVAELRPRRVAVLGPIQAGVDDTVARLRAHLGDDRAEVTGVVVEGAARAASAGNLPELERLVTAVARAVERSADVIVLGQFSLSPAAAAVAAAVSVPVLSPPHLAADALHSRLDTTRPDTTRPDTTRPDTTRPDTTRPDTTEES
jgi:Asp/Glu/hydantoin racemase